MDNPILIRGPGWSLEWDTFALHREAFLHSGYKYVAIFNDQVMGFYNNFFVYRDEKRRLRVINPQLWDSELFEIEEDLSFELVRPGYNFPFQEYLLGQDEWDNNFFNDY